jgi:hypothetical protein
VNDPSLEKDDKGLNPDFKTRVEWREEGIKRWFDEVGVETRTARSSADMKSGATDEAFKGLVSTMQNSDVSLDHLQGLMNSTGFPSGSGTPITGLPAAASSSKDPLCGLSPAKRSRTSVAGWTDSTSPASVRAGAEVTPTRTGGVATGRLLAYEESSANLNRAACALAKAAHRARAVVAAGQDEVSQAAFKDYLDIISERLGLAEFILDGAMGSDTGNKFKVTFQPASDAESPQLAEKIREKVDKLSFRPFDTIDEVLAVRELQRLACQLKKAPDEDTLKSSWAKISSAIPLLDELASAVAVSCEDLDKARKDRARREQKAEKAAKAEKAKAERKAKQAEEQKNRQGLGRQQAQASNLVKNIVPFTAPLAVGKHLTVFETWADAKGKIAETKSLLEKPFVVTDATEVSKFLDSEQCAVMPGKMAIFGKRWRDADVVRDTSRTQTRLNKGVGSLAAFFDELVKPPDVNGLPEDLQRLTGIALYGVLKGLDSFQPDYLYTSTIRYCQEGERSIVAVPAGALLEWCVENDWVKAKAGQQKDWFQEFQDFGEKAISDSIVAAWVEQGMDIMHAQVGPKTCTYVPGGYYVWESTHSDSWGVRYTFITPSCPDLDKFVEMGLDSAKHDNAKTLSQLSAWRCLAAKSS